MEKIIGIISGIIIGSAQVIYLINTLKRKVRPSVLSWFGWACLMGTSLVSQVIANGWQWSMTSISFSTIGCLTISVVALLSRNFSFERGDWKFVVLGLACVGIYLASDNPWMTTIFAILADAMLSIPTIKKAYREPALEKSPSWILGVFSSILAVSICFGHDVLYFLFPVYLVVFNLGMAVLTWGRG